ncbi:MAG: DUF6443 domain-containing protein [Cyclobacteriaceae bacterium]|uniref:Ig-like domain-containing protein n=1 Tax=Reichenbachiella sp. TaxID=2184521 RepID=UPI0032635B30
MKSSIKHSFSLFLIIAYTSVLAQISGPTVVATGTSQSYSMDPAPPFTAKWYVTSGGSFVTKNSYSATITWTSSGTITVKDGFTTIATLNVTVGSVPSAPSASNQSRCGSGAVTLTASGAPSGGNYKWYSSSSGGSALHTGSSYTTPSLSSTTSYWVSAVSSIGLESNSRTQAQAIINTIPTQPSANGASRCGTGSVTLTVQSPNPQYDYYWYTSSSGGSSVHTGSSYSTPSISSTTTYYVSRKDQCESSRRSVTATINSVPSTPSTPTITNNCGSTDLTRSSPPGGVTWYWQSSSSGTSTSNSSTTINRTSGTVYYLRARNNTSGCWSSSRTVNYTVNQVPSTPSAPTVTNNCGSTNLTRSSPPGGVTWYWQSTSSGTSTSNSSATISLSSGVEYYLRPRNNTSGCWGTARLINYSVNSLPSTPSAPTVTNNCGSTDLTRSTPPSGITWYWQSSSSGTSTSNSSATINRESGTVYYLRARNNTTGCRGTARSVNYSINVVPGLPSAPTVTNNCGSTDLTRSTPPAGVTWYWQSSSSGTSTSNSSSTLNRTSGTVYYLRARNNTSGCWSSARTVNYSIDQVPSTPSAATVTNNCGSTDLTRSIPPGGITWYWQSSSSGTSTSNSSSTINRTTGTVYYLRARNNTTGCWSSAQTVSYSIDQVPSVPSAPTVTNNCGNTDLTRSTPPGGITWYWQSTAGGTSTSNSSTTLNRNSGTVYYIRARNNTTGCWSSAQTVNYSIDQIPSVPSTPTVTNNCGSTDLTRSTPPGGITWYWQSSSSGTSTSNSSSTLNRTSGTVYYLRARNNTSGCWSSARTVNYSIDQVPSVPSAPIVTNNCGSTDLTRSTPPGGITWYWQSSSSGTSTSNSSTSVNRTTGTTYYLRARDNTTGCWGASRTVSYSIDQVPSVPSAPTITNNCGSTDLTRSTPPGGITWYWQSSSSGTSTSNSSTTVNRTTGTTYYLRAKNNTTGCWGAAQTVSYSIDQIPATPGLPTVTNNCGSTDLTRSTPPGGITWYWQSSTSGTSTSNSSTTLNRTSGTVYYLRAQDNTTGCWSSAQTINYSVDEIPAAPSTPTVTNNCGSTDLTMSTPPFGITWYWQSSSTGVSTTNSSSTVNMTTGTLYYLRARNNTSGCWGAASSVSYTVNALPSTPSNPATTNNCGETTLQVDAAPTDVTWYWQSTSTGTSTTNSGASFDRSSGTTYYVRGKDDITDCWGPALQVNYSVDAIPAQPSTVSVEKRFGKSVLMRGTPAPELDETWYWQGTDPNGTSTTNSNQYDTVTVAGTYYLRSQTTAGCWGDARSVTVTIEAEPATSQTGASEIAIGTSSELSLTTAYDTYSWKKDGTEVSTAASYTVRASGSYTVTVTKTGVSDSFTSDPVVFTGFGGFGSQNHIISSTITQSGVTNNDDVIDLSAAARRINVAYYDGLGRPIQQVAVAQSPLGRDIIQIADYDDLGREPIKYLPYVSNEQGACFHTNAIAEQLAFYSATGDDIVNDDDPYSVTIIEESPLGRVLKQGAPGTSWQPTADPEDSTDHVVRFAYRHNTSDDSVKLWKISSGMPVYVDIYDAGTLMKDVTMDENNSRLDVYKDKMGRVISRRVYDSDATWVETQYIYDVFGRLRFVLQPNLSAELNEDDSPSQDQIDTLTFQYNYDKRHRMVEKRVPGAGWVYTVYDIWDRPVLTQDSEQRTKNQWLFSTYDALNRPAMTGILEDDSPRDSLQLHLDSLVGRYITRTDTVYSATAYPFEHIGEGTLIDTLTFSFYDTYDGLPDSLAHKIPDDFTSAYAAVDSTQAIGKPVATKTSIVGSDKFLWTANFYNFRGESLQTVAENHLGGRDRITTETDFIGQVLKTRREHTTENDTVNIFERFEYDNAGRLVKHKHHITDTVVLTHNNYNELGELKEKNIGDELQSIDYQYNIRGWMTKMNNGSALDDASDMFGMELQYDAAGEYNGNIGKMIWKSPYGAGAAGEEQTFDYSYDQLNRLTEADYNLGKATEGYFSVTGISYDLNGNILTLNRWMDNVRIDSLVYSYAGNQLTEVDELSATSEEKGFKNGADGEGEYTYDSNGNMSKDMNKSITDVEYNYMNMPTKVKFLNGDSLVYTYNAGGVKLRKTFYYEEDTTDRISTTDYIGGMIYEGEGLDSTRLQIIPHAEGRVLLKELTTGKAYDHQYHLKDHLGNTRVTVRSKNESYVANEDFEGGDNGFYKLHHHPNWNATPGGSMSEWLAKDSVGAFYMLKIGKDDTLHLSVKAHYDSLPTGTTASANFFQYVFGAFGQTGLGGSLPEGVEANSSAFETAMGSTGGMSGKDNSTSAPRAYLNYIIFDTEMNYVSAGFKQISSAAEGSTEVVQIMDIIGTEPGYLLTYLSNENEEEFHVHFDDFAIYHGMSNVAQIDDYYPFGLTFNSYYGGVENKYRYNGKEQQKETGWYDYLARQYDPSIGRFTSVDPAADVMRRYSTYAYAFDNPIRYIDPDGMAPAPAPLGVSEGLWHSSTRKAGGSTGRTYKTSSDSGESLISKDDQGEGKQTGNGNDQQGDRGSQQGDKKSSDNNQQKEESITGLIEGTDQKLRGMEFDDEDQQPKHPGTIDIENSNDEIIKHLMKGLKYHIATGTKIDLKELFENIDGLNRAGSHFMGFGNYKIGDETIKIYFQVPHHDDHLRSGGTFDPYSYQDKYRNNDTRLNIRWGDSGILISVPVEYDNAIRNELGI